ncbi:MAG TPA: hypothetical protein VHX36_09005 [Candidatus Acidoferrales bacterium]|nr:hypothetical protein [Candidatus Acidoferrales bacterium]
MGLVFTLGATIFLSSCGLGQLASQLLSQDRPQFQGPSANDLVQVARTYAQGHLRAPALSVALPSEALASAGGPSDGSEQEEEYKNQIAMDFARKDYGELEKRAQADLSPTARFGGGVWRLWGYYEGLSVPPAGDSATDDDWNAQIDALKAWVAAQPDSSAARLALAGAYDSFGFRARGVGYANTVSNDGWRLFNERLAMTATTLVAAAKLKDKSPYWFSLMYDVALAQGWDKSQAKALLDAAISFEPSNYHVYRQYANFILPKWYGEEGDVQSFAEEVSTQIGGEEGDFVYFEIATTIACGCDKAQDQAELQSLSWPRIESGYAAMEHLYGHSSLKTSRFAYLAFIENDKAAAQAAFAVTGNKWNPIAWPRHSYFLQAQSWAESQQGQ